MIRNLHRQLFREGKLDQIPAHILRQLERQMKDITPNGVSIEPPSVPLYDLDDDKKGDS